MAGFTVIRGQGYDIEEFMKTHPGGSQMLELGIGRDSTIMYESAHLRDEVADRALEKLPKVDAQTLKKQGFEFDEVLQDFPTPKASALYNAIRKRAIEEVMKPVGKCTASTGTRGVPAWHYGTVLATWALALCFFLRAPGLITAAALGLSMTWIGLAVQHTANHGALCKSSWFNYLLGLTDDICVGGSSLVWRYHHQVSHHPYCNHVELDQDAHSSFPFMRLDVEQPVRPHHAYQHLYAFVAFGLLHTSVQIEDTKMLLAAQTYQIRFIGASRADIATAIALKVVHFSWLFALPFALHGVQGLALAYVATCVGSFWTALLFIVSHNLQGCKNGFELSDAAKKDWAMWQINTSATWGSSLASFFTGGLNLQIEHHLFPCIPHHLYPQLAPIVREECAKAGVRYNHFDYLFQIVPELVAFLKAMGHDNAAPVGTGVVSSTANALATGASNAAKAAKSAGKAAAEAAASLPETDVKKTEAEESSEMWLKPILFVGVYQALQEWYTYDWLDGNTDWHNTTILKPVGFTILYCLMIAGGTHYMRDRQPNPRLRKYMLTYNMYQVVLNAWCVYALIREVLMNHDSAFSFSVEQSSPKLSFLIWVHYNNKFIELLDTAFMVFNKKKEQLSVLHVYHHMLIMWSWWAVCVWGCGGIAWFSAMLNSAIHVAMYGYYTLAALKLPCPWKKMLTMMQMAQFCACMTTAVYALVNGLYPFYLSLLNMWVMLNMLVLFGNFYAKKYSAKGASAKDLAGAGRAVAEPKKIK